jgi:hypothetical protein
MKKTVTRGSRSKKHLRLVVHVAVPEGRHQEHGDGEEEEEVAGAVVAGLVARKQPEADPTLGNSDLALGPDWANSSANSSANSPANSSANSSANSPANSPANVFFYCIFSPNVLATISQKENR